MDTLVAATVFAFRIKKAQQMDWQIERETDSMVGGPADGRRQMEKWLDEQVEMWMDRQTDEWMNDQTGRPAVF